MADATSTPAATSPDGPSHYEWFSASPDPWHELVRLEYGADRTLASALEVAISRAEPAEWPKLEAKLLSVVTRSDCTDAARQFVCRQLGLIGDRATAAALSSWLSDPKRSDAARYALDSIRGEDVNTAYRNALTRLEGATLLGLIGSLALRDDRAAVPNLRMLAAASASVPVREACQRAIARLSS